MSCPLSTLMPTHAMLAALLDHEQTQATDLPSGAIVQSPIVSDQSEMSDRSEPVILKYVILENDFPIIFARELCHRDMLPLGFRALSAGFIYLTGDRFHVPDIGSETLHLNPRPQDRELLKNFLAR